ncbi:MULTISPECIES: HP0495 family protein [Legionella]|uniref:UPF0250 protein EKM59_07255 n=1 Tax=Legionella septentrionalis TaxID=2498109 RepID=A0A433JIR7_9GAMM|nr:MULTISPECIES: DUF493 domain-containing protein [Legionella]MCP0913293.1 DUF493 domain-containing protein [Legionella sp. 27cVA30]RUQ85205.1 DUF493 domain-containing protein [Legionella septentrionalis]
MTEQTLMKFPCNFQIKIIGKNDEKFTAEIMDIARRHYPSLKDSEMKAQPSQQGNYLAISIIVYAEDQSTLDALYIELTQHPDIKMVL